MSLKPGWYRLQIVSTDHPDPGVGGMFLTLDHHGKVVVAAIGPDTKPEAQKWHVIAVNEEAKLYKIEKYKVEPDVGLREGEGEPVPVVFGPGAEKWRISGTGAAPDVYFISSTTELIGIQKLVSTEGFEVVVKIFPVVPGDRPAWKFLPLEA